MEGGDILDERVIRRQGRFQRIQRWWRGIHPERGQIHYGWSGWETLEERDRIVPTKTFVVGIPRQNA